MGRQILAKQVLLTLRQETNSLLRNPGTCPRKFSVSEKIFEAIKEDVELRWDEHKKRSLAFYIGIPVVVDRRLKDFQVVI